MSIGDGQKVQTFSEKKRSPLQENMCDEKEETAGLR